MKLPAQDFFLQTFTPKTTIKMQSNRGTKEEIFQNGIPLKAKNFPNTENKIVVQGIFPNDDWSATVNFNEIEILTTVAEAIIKVSCDWNMAPVYTFQQAMDEYPFTTLRDNNGKMDVYFKPTNIRDLGDAEFELQELLEEIAKYPEFKVEGIEKWSEI